MKDYLIDSNILIWMFGNSGRLSSEVRDVLSNTDSVLNYSAISLWEINIKHSLGKLDLHGKSPEDLRLLALKSDLNELAITGDLANTLSSLPAKENHHDPFDRLIIWQAVKSGYTLISADKKFKQYEADGLKLIENT